VVGPAAVDTVLEDRLPAVEGGPALAVEPRVIGDVVGPPDEPVQGI
jgi:hypothetical protein